MSKLVKYFISFVKGNPSKWKYKNELNVELFEISKTWDELFDTYDIKSISSVWHEKKKVNYEDVYESSLIIESNKGKKYYISFEENRSHVMKFFEWLGKHSSALVRDEEKLFWANYKPMSKPFWDECLDFSRQNRVIECLDKQIKNNLNLVNELNVNAAFEADIASRYLEHLREKAKAIEGKKFLGKQIEKPKNDEGRKVKI